LGDIFWLVVAVQPGILWRPENEEEFLDVLSNVNFSNVDYRLAKLQAEGQQLERNVYMS
jgi:hypothetical protein